MRIILFSVWMLLAIVAAFTVFYVSSLVNEQEEYIRKLNNSISMMEGDIDILHAEWSLLTNPERIEKLANIYLSDMTVMKAEQGMPNILNIAYAQTLTPADASVEGQQSARQTATNSIEMAQNVAMRKMPSPPYPNLYLSNIAMTGGNG